MRRQLILFSILLVAAVAARAEVVLPQFFQSGMVLQRGKPVPVWGTAAAGEKVTVCINKKRYEAVADAGGRWRVDLPAMKAGGPHVLEVSGEGSQPIVLTDVLVGDVWLCSGQSNIDVTIERVYPQYPEEIDAYANDRIRLLRVRNEADTHGPKTDILPTSWKTLNKNNAWSFSAVGYFLGKRMYERYKVPQGIIVNSWGGTPVEAWVSADSLRDDFPRYFRQTQLWQDDDLARSLQRANSIADRQWRRVMDQNDPGVSGQWTSDAFDDSQWPEMHQYSMEWAKKNGQGVIGSLWVRQHLHIDKAHAGKPARLLVGTLFDSDVTYVNGRQVGTTGYQYPPRRYQIPAGLLHEGDNALTIRFINKFGTAHFIKEKPYMLIFEPGDTLRLSEQWRYHIGAEMPSCPSADCSLQNLPSTLYNAVLHPLAPYALSGVVWYQGESNTDRPHEYQPLLTKLITGWRQLWKEELPFVVVQLANFMEPSAGPQNSQWAQLREAQRLTTVSLPRTELAAAIDLGETVDIHPLRKKEVAARLGGCFDRLVFNARVPLSPKVVSARRDADGTVVLTLDQPMKSGKLYEFELADASGRFVNAEAEAAGTTVRIKAPVSQAERVRYGWKDNPIRANAYSEAGLPLAPFEMNF